MKRETGTSYHSRPPQMARAEAEILSLTLRLAVLEDLTRLIGRQMPVEQACEAIINLVPTLLDADAVSMLLLNPQTGAFTTVATGGNRANTVRKVSPTTTQAPSIAHWVATRKEPLALPSPTNDQRFSPSIDGLLNWPLRSLACVPMLAQGKVVGVIQIFNRTENVFFSDAELDLLSNLANQGAQIVENARLIEALAKSNRQLASLIEVTRKVASSLDLRTVLTEILNAAVGVLGGNAASILLVDEKTHELFFEATLGHTGLLLERYRVPPGKGIAGWVVKEQKPVYVREAEADPRFDATVSRLVGLEVHSIVAAPLNVHDDTIGVLEILNVPEGEEDERIAVLYPFAERAALAVSNARLLQKAREGSPTNATDQLSDALAGEREWSASIEQATSEGVVLVDSDGNMLRANPSARLLLELPREALPNLKNIASDPPLASALPTGPQVPQSLELTIGGVSGHRHLKAKFFQMPNHQSLIAFSNLTTEKRLEEVQKDIDFFISHALLMPILAIREHIDALIAGDKVPEDVASALRLIRQECETLLERMGSAAQLAEVEFGLTLSIEPVALAGLVEKALADDSLGLEKRKVNVHIPPDLPPLAADSEKMLQMLVALLSNAVKYSPAGSSITIKARRYPRGRVGVSVSDEGTGIPEQEIPLVFNKYYAAKTPPPYETGTGLGLYLVQQLVEAHGGRIQVKSKSGKGSTFTLILPIHPEER